MCTIAITTSKSCKVLETTHLRYICDAIFMVDEVGSSHPPFLMFPMSSAFCWYLTLAFKEHVAPTRVVKDTHSEY